MPRCTPVITRAASRGPTEKDVEAPKPRKAEMWVAALWTAPEKPVWDGVHGKKEYRRLNPQDEYNVNDGNINKSRGEVLTLTFTTVLAAPPAAATCLSTTVERSMAMSSLTCKLTCTQSGVEL